MVETREKYLERADNARSLLTNEQALAIFSGETLMVDKSKLEDLRNRAAAIGYEPKLQSKKKMVELGDEVFEGIEALLGDR